MMTKTRTNSSFSRAYVEIKIPPVKLRRAMNLHRAANVKSLAAMETAID